jgi:hypothetical protein
MRVVRDSFLMFKDAGFLISLAIVLLFEAGFAAIMLVLTSGS